MINAAERADAADFIETLPNGYETGLGRRWNVAWNFLVGNGKNRPGTRIYASI